MYHRPADSWRNFSQSILEKEKYKGTILQRYITENERFWYETLLDSMNMAVFTQIVRDKKKEIFLSGEKELVVYVRAGDVVVHNWFDELSFTNLIREEMRGRDIHKISFVTCFYYANFDKWIPSNAKQRKNVKKLKSIFRETMEEFPEVEVDVVSHDDADTDFLYLAFAKNLLRYQIVYYSGFLQLITELRHCLGLDWRKQLSWLKC